MRSMRQEGSEHCANGLENSRPKGRRNRKIRPIVQINGKRKYADVWGADSQQKSFFQLGELAQSYAESIEQPIRNRPLQMKYTRRQVPLARTE